MPLILSLSLKPNLIDNLFPKFFFSIELFKHGAFCSIFTDMSCKGACLEIRVVLVPVRRFHDISVKVCQILPCFI